MSFQNFRIVCGVTKNELVISVLTEQSNADFEIFFGGSAESLLGHFISLGEFRFDELNILDLDEPVNPHR